MPVKTLTHLFLKCYFYFFNCPIFRNGEEISASAHFIIRKEKNRRSLIVKNVTIEDSAEFTCVLGSLKTSCKMTVLGRCLVNDYNYIHMV